MKKIRLKRGPVGSWDNPRHLGLPLAARTNELARFGRLVLAILDESPEWDASTLDLIGEAAEHCGLVSDYTTPVLTTVLAERRAARIHRAAREADESTGNKN